MLNYYKFKRDIDIIFLGIYIKRIFGMIRFAINGNLDRLLRWFDTAVKGFLFSYQYVMVCLSSVLNRSYHPIYENYSD